jgi:hypothetical protein
MKKKKDNRGGQREGAGRPKSKEPTIVMRVPKSLEIVIRDIITKHYIKQKSL